MLNKKIFFLSDFHLGIPNISESEKREKHIVQFLDCIENECAELFIIGDIFDFWFEYKHVVPKGYFRLLNRLAQFSDKGIKLHIFEGNHDLWQFGYLEKSLNATVYKKPIFFERNGKKFYVGHGDGLGPKQNKFKFILWMYRNPILQKLFAWIHPDIGIPIANWFSSESKKKTYAGNYTFYGEHEYLIRHCREELGVDSADFFIFGHRHLPMIYPLNNKSAYINTGDWIQFYTFVEFDGNFATMKKFDPQNGIQIFKGSKIENGRITFEH